MATPDSTVRDPATSAGTIMHRKAEVGRAEHQARAMTLAKALRQSFAKVADETLEMPLAVLGVRSEDRAGDKLEPVFADPGLRILLDGPGQTRGAAMFSPQIVTALIQQQTMGKVLKSQGDEERTLTQTDAAICAPFLEAVLKRAAPLPEAPEDQQKITGYKFGAWVEDARLLSLALEAPDYEIIRISLDIAGGVQQGEIVLCLPVVEVVQPMAEGDVDADDAAADSAGGVLTETVQNLNAELRISLARVTMSVRELGALEVGSTFGIGAPDFQKITVQTLTGKTISRGALGQVDGQRAVQVAHAHKGMQEPKRRSRDRDDLGLPDIDAEPLGLPTPAAMDDGAIPDQPLPDLPDLNDEALDLPDLPDLPDMSDVDDAPALSDLPDLPDLEDLPNLKDLPDLGDMPDLADLPKVGTG